MVEYKSSKMNVIKKGDKIEFEKEKEKEMKVFEIGKCYRHINEKMRIIGEINTHFYGECLLGETEEGELVPVGKTESHFENWEECEDFAKEEIKAGDEIESYEQAEKAVVLWVEADGILCCLQEDQFFTVKEKQKKYWKKTGRHYDEVEKIFQKLKEEEGGNTIFMKMDEKEIAAELSEKYCLKVEMNNEDLKAYTENLRSGKWFRVTPAEPKVIYDERMEHLKQIALELLEKYEESEEGIIWEYSGEIGKDTAELKTEVEQYKERIEGLTK